MLPETIRPELRGVKRYFDLRERFPCPTIPLDIPQATAYYLAMKSLLSDLALTVLGVVFLSVCLFA